MQEPQKRPSFKPDLTLDILILIVSFLEINELLIPTLINRTWYRATLPRWRELLVRDFEVEPNIAKVLPHPNIVYRKISQAISEKNNKYHDFIAKYGLGSFCVCIDVEDKQKLADFFQNNTIPDLKDIGYLGNLSLVKYLIEDCNRSFACATVSAKMSGSIPMLLYFIEQWGLSDTDRDPYYQELPVDSKELLHHWDKLARFMSYPSLALTGSIEAFKKLDANQDKYPDLTSIFYNAIDSGSLTFLRYLYEDPSCPLRQSLDRELKHHMCNLYENMRLDHAARRGILVVVKYMVEARKIKPRHETMLRAVESGSLVIANYVREHRQESSQEKTNNDNIYPFVAVRSGSLRMAKYQREVCKRQNSTKNDLNHAAELGLTPVLSFILDHNPPPANQETHECLLRSNLASLNFLSKFPTLQLGQQELLYCCGQNNLFFLRRLVEEKKLLPTEETKVEITKILDECTKLRPYNNAKYVMSVTTRNNSASFWNRVLSFPCKNTVDRLTSEILFDNKGKPRQWFSQVFAAFRALKGRLYANTFLNPCDYLTITDEPEEKDKVISVEVTWIMATILNIIKNLPEVALKKSFLQSEQMYLRALQAIQVKLEEGMSYKFEHLAALAFYRRWHEIIGEVLANNMEIETGVAVGLGAISEGPSP